MSFATCFSKVFSRIIRKSLDIQLTGSTKRIEVPEVVPDRVTNKQRICRSAEQLTKDRQAIATYLLEHDGSFIHAREIANALNMPINNVRYDAKRLPKTGGKYLIISTSSGYFCGKMYN